MSRLEGLGGGDDGKKGGGDGKKSFKAPAPVAKGRRSKSKDGKASAVARKVEPGMIKNTLITVRRNYIWQTRLPQELHV